ncbi:MAG: glycosyltransferase family 2 protein [Chloroflexi bacterium]|nr:glycosyltransferase family 2 protein [Chloroflexota bacterium]
MDKTYLIKNQLYIVILNWNQLKDTTECIESIQKQTYKDFHVVLVDNGSSDNSIPVIREKFPWIEIIENKKNLGFQGGMNIGIRYALSNKAEFILLLNNDIVADPEMIQHLLEDFPDEAGVVSPVMYYYSNPMKVWSFGGKINPWLLEILKFPREKIILANQLIERDFVPACAWLLKKTVVEKVGLFDESFFPAYYEDLDFCLRIRRGGFKIYINPKAKLWHKVSASSGGECNPFERYHMARNSGYYFRKNMKIWQAPIIILYRIGSALIGTIRLIYNHQIAILKVYWKGLIDGWFGQLPK